MGTIRKPAYDSAGDEVLGRPEGCFPDPAMTSARQGMQAATRLLSRAGYDVQTSLPDENQGQTKRASLPPLRGRVGLA